MFKKGEQLKLYGTDMIVTYVKKKCDLYHWVRKSDGEKVAVIENRLIKIN